ncbi:MAG: hypothetical protein J6C01_03250, partial [Lachnospiraceae bacterium]|nr:hypothetical protein [Lachnospiraceae bacterium]
MKSKKFAIITLLLAFICFMVYSFLPDCSYKQKNGNIQFQNPESYTTSENGWNAIIDNRHSIYCLDENELLTYAVDLHQLGFKNAEIIDITFHSDNHLYCHVAVYNEDAYLTDSEVILEIDTTGTLVREILHYDYTKNDIPPIHQTRILGLYCNNNMLFYLYKEDNGYSIVALNPDNPQQTESVSIEQDGYGEIIKCHNTSDGEFLVLKNNGEIGTISLDGTYQLIDKAAYDTRTTDGIFPYDVFEIKDKIYMLAGQNELTLYEWNNENWTPLLPIQKSIQMSDDTDLLIFGLGEYEQKLALHVNESIYI